MTNVIEKHIDFSELKESKKIFTNIFTEWHCIIDRYLNYTNYEDAPWWYNERATLSTVASAATMSNHVILEEYRTDKNHETKTKYGRCDLFIGIKNRGYAIEAKHAWCKIGTNTNNRISKINETLKSAIKDTKKLDKREGTRLALCFVAPELPPSDVDRIDHLISEWQRELKEKYSGSLAWYFPSKTRKLTNHKGFFYPGVVAVLQKVHRGYKATKVSDKS